ncbi:uncharacterized protein LOC117817313 isoform X2 [Notolabrus celidotus]|uniref:uncharacterized protein LOC117817313 isoform X2 n=1 Tax=Notolabrus celidotus TaxID=1203425 RepID=UPI00148FC2B8|nr:uncharacterized protein LOC117817313 isoform X2 [Notolabrus celidotus]
MNETSSQCSISDYLNLCASSKVLLLVPGFGLNIFILVSLVSCLLNKQRKIRGNVAMFILGSTCCNLVNLSLWPMTIYWKQHGRWLLGSRMCEVMVSAKHLTSSASFHYVSFITFSIYLTVVCGCRHLVNSRVFLALQLLFPLLPVVLKDLTLWILGLHVGHLDPSAKVIHRSQRVNVHLAKVFSLISLITFTAHVPGAVFALMEHPSVCQEMVRDLLLDLPLLSSPIILLCMNKELRNQCVLLLQRKPANWYEGKTSISKTYEQDKNLTNGESDTFQL